MSVLGEVCLRPGVPRSQTGWSRGQRILRWAHWSQLSLSFTATKAQSMPCRQGEGLRGAP